MRESGACLDSRGPGEETVASADPAAINHLPGSMVRYASLDAVRGVAALSVILFHTSWPTHPTVTTFARNCYTAVDLFFLLSGFVIAASYQARVATFGEIVAFTKRRMFRIYPLHLAVMAWLVAVELVTLAAAWRSGPAALATSGAFTGIRSGALLVPNLLLVQGTGLFPETSWNPPSWSVSAELVAYLLFAITGYLGLLRKPMFVASVAYGGLAAYAVLAWGFGTLDLTTELGIVRCLAGFPIGVALFQFTANGRCVPLRRMTVAMASLLEGAAVLATGLVLGLAQGGLVVLVMPCFIAILFLFQAERGLVSRALRARPFQWLGAISYSVYLVHVPIRNQIIGIVQHLGVSAHLTPEGRTILDVTPAAGDGLLLVFMISALAVAALTFRFIEEPARLFGRRLSSPARSAGQRRLGWLKP